MPGLLKSLTNTLPRGFLHLLYPDICWACGRSLPLDQGAFCANCRTALTDDPHRTCPYCSSTVGAYAQIEKKCPQCRGQSYAFGRAVRLAPYEGQLREVILRMKLPNGEGLADVVGRLWAERAEQSLRSLQAHVVVPVPLHWLRRWSRGYNQAETLARAVAKRLSLPCLPRALRRIRNTPRQTHTTSPAARRENVRGAFQARSFVDLKNKTVLLIDDVLTTGSTASEAARALKKAGAANVAVAVLAHGH